LVKWLHRRRNPSKPNSGPIRDEELSYLSAGADLIGMASQPRGSLLRYLRGSSLVHRLFEEPPKPGQAYDGSTIYFSERKVEGLGNIIVVSLGLIMLYVPMWWLNVVVDDSKRLAIITVFVFLFAIGLRIVGSGRPFETLAATAAYAAVLMMFMQKQPASHLKT
jgi:hypothetical protein